MDTWRHILCWIMGHNFDAGTGIGWTGYIQFNCKRCGHSERKHHRQC